MGAKTDRARGAWAKLIACSWLIEQGFVVYRNESDYGKAHLVIEIGGRFLGARVSLTTVDFSNPAKPRIVEGCSLTAEQQDAGILEICVSHDGVCSFGRARLQEVYRAAAQQASGMADTAEGRLHPRFEGSA